MKILLLIFNLLLEFVYYLFFPFWFLLMLSKGYTQAIKCNGDNLGKGILFHAASMGEVAAIKPLILKIAEQNPEIKLGITTVTLSGLQQASSISPKVQAWLSVLDVKHLREKQLAKINPGLICIVETEIWPNMLLQAAKQGMKVLFLNARISDISMSRYKSLSALIRKIEKPVRKILAQSEEDSTKFSQIFGKETINAGNLKFCLALPDYSSQEIRMAWGFSETDLIICFGSSRPGEEEMMLSAWKALLGTIPPLKLIIAIRHPKRIDELQGLLGNYPVKYYSSLKKDGPNLSPILFIDSLGVLDKAYAICDIAIVGGSFFDFGGHNPLEPAYYAKPILIGPYHHSCRDSVKKLSLDNGIIISDKDKLVQDLQTLCDDPVYCKQIGGNAKKVLTKNATALETHYREVIKVFREE
jgi:3-deoxy-D-manno-octulosonic-acid transferase